MTHPPRPAATSLMTPAAGSPLRDRLTQASDRAASLARASRELSGAMQTDRAVDLVLQMLAGPVVAWAQVTVVDRRTYEFRSRDALGLDREGRLPMGAVDPLTSLGRVLATGVTDRVDGSQAASAVPCDDLRADLETRGPVELLTLALTARGTTYGALTVAQRAGEGYDEQAVLFLEDFAHRVSVTLDTARALADSRRVASVLAKDLAPPTLPSFAGVEMASYYRVAFEHDALGGDFYDVHGDDDGWTAVMGDVCGKGVEAAVLTGKVRQAIRTAALIDRDPAWMLELANRVLLVDGDDVFVTAVCARGRRVGDVVTLDVATAGHPAPLVVRQDGSVEEVAVSGAVLGLLDDVSYRSVQVELGVGETCVFLTDGVTEAPGRRGRFGDERLRDVLVATGACDVRAQVESVAVAVTRHLLDRAHDDIAILAIQCREAE